MTEIKIGSQIRWRKSSTVCTGRVEWIYKDPTTGEPYYRSRSDAKNGKKQFVYLADIERANKPMGSYPKRHRTKEAK